jgi:hypothetical protein
MLHTGVAEYRQWKLFGLKPSITELIAGLPGACQWGPDA